MNHPNEAITDLRALAPVVVNGHLCSLLFPFFINGFLQDTGHEPSGEVREIARQIAEEYEGGIHRTPEEIAAILRARADELERGVPAS